MGMGMGIGNGVFTWANRIVAREFVLLWGVLGGEKSCVCSGNPWSSRF